MAMAMAAPTQALFNPPFKNGYGSGKQDICKLGIPGISMPSQPSRIRTSIRCSATDKFTSPKSGAVGVERFKDGAVPGTYWGEIAELGEEVIISFNKGHEKVTSTARVGENLLRVAERCGVMTPDLDFCFEGTCCHCEMEVLGGAKEVGYRAGSSGDELIRSCICPVPPGRSRMQVNLINEEDVWGDGVL